jgi:putative transposase
MYLYFLGLTTRNVAKALSFLHIVKRSHVLLAKKWKWIQKHNPSKDIIEEKKDFRIYHR